MSILVRNAENQMMFNEKTQDPVLNAKKKQRCCSGKSRIALVNDFEKRR